ncbi:MAG: ScpA family protein [Bifidobacteriaceae bacterium]|nr:ScpA family protein [Bifidobacteriaceae bacterium]
MSDQEHVLEDHNTNTTGFSVNLEVYSGPFDALLSLVANKKLELTELSLSIITEEFLAYIQTLDLTQDMEQASAFLDVASILVDAKSAALLPYDDENDEQSMEALRERDLLFARLLQYRAFREASDVLRECFAANSGRYAHPAYIDANVANTLPDIQWNVSAEQLAQLAVHAFINAPAQSVSLHQLHVPMVDLQEQSAIVQHRLRSLPEHGAISFSEIIEDTTRNIEIVARFLAVLALFKQGFIQFKQQQPFEELQLRWVGNSDDDLIISEGDFA